MYFAVNIAYQTCYEFCVATVGCAVLLLLLDFICS